MAVDDPLPEADAVVSVGHVLNYLPDEDALRRALRAAAAALRPDGVLALDLCDLEWGRSRLGAPAAGFVGEDWALVTRFSVPRADRFVRHMTVFTRNDDGSWRRDEERHDNVLIDTAEVQPLLSEHGVDAEVRRSFGQEALPAGLHVVVGHRATGPLPNRH